MLRRDLLKSMAAAPLGLANSFDLKAKQQRYQADWASIDSRPIPRWYTDAKFGIFIHWGVYSVPAFAVPNAPHQNPYAEWYWHSLTEGKKATGPAGEDAMTWAFHKRVYGADFPYYDFASQFRAELFQPDQWADLFVQSGAKYVALTSKHHEGFTLWKNAEANRSWLRPWNSVDIGPKRDLLIDLMEAGRAKGLEMGIYYSLYEWYNPLWLSDKKRYVTGHMIPQFKDVVTHAKPSIIFSDGEWELPSDEWHSTEILSWLYNDSPVADHVVVDDRWGKETRHKHGGYYTTEYTSGMQQSNHAWEESRGMGFSYGYNRNETLKDYHTERELDLMLVDIVSRGGNLLLDIGPRADGHIPPIMEERLTGIGNWLRPNGDAIYGTSALPRTRQWSKGSVPRLEEKEFRADYDITKMVDAPPPGYARVDAFFTSKGDDLYVMLPRWPEGPVVLDGFSGPSTARVTILETGDECRWKTSGSRIDIEVPEHARNKLPFRELYALKLEGMKQSA
jgi:alpha-L-fucosidase